MLDESDREADKRYGPWGWLLGFALGALLIALMFGLAQS